MARRRLSRSQSPNAPSSVYQAPAQRFRAHESVLQERLNSLELESILARRAVVEPVYRSALARRVAYRPGTVSKYSLSPLSNGRAAARLPSGRGARDRLISLAADRRVLFCVRRRERRAVLFARRVAGKRGVGVGKRWRRTITSQWRC